MNEKKLREHVEIFVKKMKKDKKQNLDDIRERQELLNYYQSFSSNKILNMTEEDIYEYISKLWAMRIWGNKKYIVDKIIDDNGLDEFKMKLNNLLYGDNDIEERWDNFRSEVKGMGPAMISEILCKTYPGKYFLWNRRAYIALNYLEVPNLPRYDYQLDGNVYKKLCQIAKKISKALEEEGYEDTSLFAVDYLIWHELQVEDNLSKILKSKDQDNIPKDKKASEFMHNDVRDKLRDIGEWLGLSADIEQKVAIGSQIDTIWEATIGNMGRVIYIFEVQTGGNIKSLVLNLLKALNNPAVQGVVAVSDSEQLEKIKKNAEGVKGLEEKLKYWNYEEVLKVHESLQYVNETINELDLVPEGF